MAVRDTHLRTLAGAIAVSAIGDWVAVIALGFRANDMWDGGVDFLLICLWSPIALFAGHGDPVVDLLQHQGFVRPDEGGELGQDHERRVGVE